MHLIDKYNNSQNNNYNPNAKIIKTVKEEDKHRCPVCGRYANLGCCTVELKGFFKLRKRMIYNYTCMDCKTEYEIEDDWQKL